MNRIPAPKHEALTIVKIVKGKYLVHYKDYPFYIWRNGRTTWEIALFLSETKEKLQAFRYGYTTKNYATSEAMRVVDEKIKDGLPALYDRKQHIVRQSIR